MGNELFETALPILNQIEKHHFEAYFVGGQSEITLCIVQFMILISLQVRCQTKLKIYLNTIPIGKEHGTINVVFNNENYEVTTFRSEGDYLDHRRPSEVNFVKSL